MKNRSPQQQSNKRSQDQKSRSQDARQDNYRQRPNQNAAGRTQSKEKRGMGERRQSKNPKNSPPVTEPVEKIVTTEKGWKRPVVNLDDEESKNQAIFRTIRGILNKITVERFEELTKELKKIPITSPEVLDGMIGLIFDKATDESHFSFMYAKLCLQLQKDSPTFGEVTFRRCLLNRCQEKFFNPEEENVFYYYYLIFFKKKINLNKI